MKPPTEDTDISSTEIKAEIFSYLGAACARCGYNNSPAPLYIVTAKDLEVKPAKTQYGIWIARALISAKGGEGKFALLCSNCRMERLYTNSLLPEPVAPLSPVVPTVVAFWSAEHPPETLLKWRAPWFDVQEKIGYPGFVMPSDGRVYPYKPEEPWQIAKPVAENFKEFARARGLSEKAPKPGTVVLKPIEESE